MKPKLTALRVLKVRLNADCPDTQSAEDQVERELDSALDETLAEIRQFAVQKLTVAGRQVVLG